MISVDQTYFELTYKLLLYQFVTLSPYTNLFGTSTSIHRPPGWVNWTAAQMLYPSARKIQSRPGMLPIVLWWCLALQSCGAAVLWCYGSCLGSPQAVLRPYSSSLLNQTTFPRALLKPWLRPLSLLVWQLPHKGSACLCSPSSSPLLHPTLPLSCCSQHVIQSQMWHTGSWHTCPGHHVVTPCCILCSVTIL